MALAGATARWAEPGATLLHVCGEEAPGTLADTLTAKGFAVQRAVLYGMATAQALPPEDVGHGDGGAVQLHAMRAHIHPAQLGFVQAVYLSLAAMVVLQSLNGWFNGMQIGRAHV